jgi:S-adenosyl methyltransferase
MRKVTVTEQDEQERRDRWKALGIRTDSPYPARVYDYLLGGKDNFAADREMAELSLRVMPEVRDSARANRRFLIRAVRFLRDVDHVLAAAGELLDFGKPVGLLFVASLHNIPDADDPAGIVARYLTALAPGSYLAISHVTDEFAPERMHAVTAEYQRRGTTFIGRGKAAIRRMFNGRELVDPGLVVMSHWRPDDSRPDYDPDRVWGYCGVART